MNTGQAMTVREYWRQIRELQKTLPEVVWITSMPDPYGDVRRGRSGVVVECDNENAAKCILGRTHRLATDEEVEAYQQESLVKRDQMKRAEYASKGFAFVSVPPVAAKSK